MTKWWGSIAVELTPSWGYNQYLLLWVTMNPGWGSIAVELTPQWGCVTT